MQAIHFAQCRLSSEPLPHSVPASLPQAQASSHSCSSGQHESWAVSAALTLDYLEAKILSTSQFTSHVSNFELIQLLKLESVYVCWASTMQKENVMN